jgi:hypothetical protein
MKGATNARRALAMAAAVVATGAVAPGTGTAQQPWVAPPGTPASGFGARDLARPSLSSHLPHGHQRIVSTIFHVPGSGICRTVAFVAGGVARDQTASGCHPVERLEADLAAEPALVDGFSFPRRYLLAFGYVRSDIRAISLRWPPTRVDVSVSAPWTADGGGRDQLPLRSFLMRIWEGEAVDLSLHGDGPMLAFRDVDLVALFDNGDMSPIDFASPAANGKRYPRMLDPIASTPARAVAIPQSEETARL